jgi:hypothetical protein
MTAILFDSARPVQSDPAFGALLRRERRMSFTQADLDWVAQTFGELESDREDRELEDRAAEASY